MFRTPFKLGRGVRESAQGAADARTSGFFGDTERARDLGIGLLLDDTQAQRLTMLKRQFGQGRSNNYALCAKISQLLDALVVGVSQRRDSESEFSHSSPIYGSSAKVSAELVARNPEYPGKGLAVAGTPELLAVGERLRERLSHEIDSNLRLQGPACEKAQQVCGVRFVEAGEVVGAKRHRDLNL
jgi:hypothetical protein